MLLPQTMTTVLACLHCCEVIRLLAVSTPVTVQSAHEPGPDTLHVKLRANVKRRCVHHNSMMQQHHPLVHLTTRVTGSVMHAQSPALQVTQALSPPVTATASTPTCRNGPNWWLAISLNTLSVWMSDGLHLSSMEACNSGQAIHWLQQVGCCVCYLSPTYSERADKRAQLLCSCEGLVEKSIFGGRALP